MTTDYIDIEYCPPHIPSTTLLRMVLSETNMNSITEMRMTETGEAVLHHRTVYPDDIIKILKKGNCEDPFNSTHIAIVELICEIRKLDELQFHEIHPLIDEILKVDDYTLKTQWQRLNELYKETKSRRDEGCIYLPYEVSDCYAFKIEDRKGVMHMFTIDFRSFSLKELTKAIVLILGDEVPLKILYKRDDGDGDVQPDCGDKVVIASDRDLYDAVTYAISAKCRVLKLHLEYSATPARSSSRVFCVIKRVLGLI